ncbi:MAG: hypothetical protein KDA79_13235 [Planctomycetaceae bacterium]|nr:hypothetical protein [Planctomycetaceae bacterium]
MVDRCRGGVTRWPVVSAADFHLWECDRETWTPLQIFPRKKQEDRIDHPMKQFSEGNSRLQGE